jgi:hypothetical protein
MLERVAAIVLIGTFALTNSASAAVTVVDPGYSLVFRSTSVQGFPITVDSAGNVYTVTGTSIDDSLVKIAPNGAPIVLNGAVNHVVGVFADLKFGFGGNLFANCGVNGYPSPQGVVQFNTVTGAASDFYTYSLGYADGGLAFNSSTQTLYLSNEQDPALTALNSSGQPTQVLSYLTGDVAGMDIENNGDILAMDRVTGDVIQVNPVTQTQQTLVDLSQLLPNQTFDKIAVDPANGDIFFDSNTNDANKEGFLYRLNPDGSNLTEIAYDVNSASGLIGLAVGASGDGSGAMSVYVTDPGTTQILEIRPVPEPAFGSAVLMLGAGALRRRRGSGVLVRAKS